MSEVIDGTGRLRINGEDKGSCSYSLFVREYDGNRTANGSVEMNYATLSEALEAKSGVTITRDDTGFEMKVVVMQVHKDGADIKLSGPPE